MFRRIFKRSGEKRIFELPDEKALAEKHHKVVTSFWRGALHKESQSIVPLPRSLQNKLSIQKGEKVFVFAAYTGEWAKALADLGAKVYYSDLSPSALKEAKKRHSGAFEKAMQRNAIFFPLEKKKYDWSFSFEPIPLQGSGLALASIRALLNNKGLMLVYGPGAEVFYLKKTLRAIAITYKASFKLEKFEIEAKRQGKIEKTKIFVFKLLTNENARKRALQDLKLLELLRIARNRGKIISKRGLISLTYETSLKSLEEIAKEKGLNLSEREIKESLKRLNILFRNIPELRFKLDVSVGD